MYTALAMLESSRPLSTSVSMYSLSWSVSLPAYLHRNQLRQKRWLHVSTHEHMKQKSLLRREQLMFSPSSPPNTEYAGASGSAGVSSTSPSSNIDCKRRRLCK